MKMNSIYSFEKAIVDKVGLVNLKDGEPPASRSVKRFETVADEAHPVPDGQAQQARIGGTAGGKNSRPHEKNLAKIDC